MGIVQVNNTKSTWKMSDCYFMYALQVTITLENRSNSDSVVIQCMVNYLNHQYNLFVQNYNMFTNKMMCNTIASIPNSLQLCNSGQTMGWSCTCVSCVTLVIIIWKSISLKSNSLPQFNMIFRLKHLQ